MADDDTLNLDELEAQLQATFAGELSEGESNPNAENAASPADSNQAKPDTGSPDKSTPAKQEDVANPGEGKAPDTTGSASEEAQRKLAEQEAELERLRQAQVETPKPEIELAVKPYTDDERQAMIDLHGELDAQVLFDNRDTMLALQQQNLEQAQKLAQLEADRAQDKEEAAAAQAEVEILEMMQATPTVAAVRQKSRENPDDPMAQAHFSLVLALLDTVSAIPANKDKPFTDKLKLAEAEFLKMSGQPAVSSAPGPTKAPPLTVPNSIDDFAGKAPNTPTEALQKKFESGQDMTDDEYREMDDRLGF